MQFHPVSEDIIHADFYEVDANSPLSIPVPVKVVGNSPGVMAGGKLQLKIKKLNVSGLITDLPEFIEVDISEMVTQNTLRMREGNCDSAGELRLLLQIGYRGYVPTIVLILDGNSEHVAHA